jgi:multidrug efflux pump subunit AcrB
MDEGGFILDYWAPTGGALSETDRQVGVLERILLADPDVQAFTRRTGSELGFAATAPNGRLHRSAQTVAGAPRRSTR